MMEKKIIQITSGSGPLECCRVVAKVLELMLKHAGQVNLQADVLEKRPAEVKETMYSATVLLSGPTIDQFISEWQGTIQWIAQSPFRPLHKRKNWFVGVEVFDIPEVQRWNGSEVRFETCRASGPGGQNVNKVETAVRGIHIPTGLQVLVMDTNSQLLNKKLCLERLELKVKALQQNERLAFQKSQWDDHHSLKRGDAIKTIKAPL